MALVPACFLTSLYNDAQCVVTLNGAGAALVPNGVGKTTLSLLAPKSSSISTPSATAPLVVGLDKPQQTPPLQRLQQPPSLFLTLENPPYFNAVSNYFPLFLASVLL